MAESNGDAEKADGAAHPEWDPWGIPNFTSALELALQPFAEVENEWTLEEMVHNIAKKMAKVANKFWETDDRLAVRGNATRGRALIEEFVETVMGPVSGACSDKAWFFKVDYAPALTAAAVFCFRGSKALARTMLPMVEKIVQESVYRWSEEERLDRCIWDAVDASGVKESFRKKCRTHLGTAYDEAHMKSPWGTTTADTQELTMLQDFVKGWITVFVTRAWDILQHGILDVPETTRDQKVLFCTVLFQALTQPENACLPTDITSLVETPPPNPWPFIAAACESVFKEMDEYAEKAAAEKEAQEASQAKLADIVIGEPSAKRLKSEGVGGGLDGMDTPASQGVADWNA